MEEYSAKFREWLLCADAETQKELKLIENDDEQIKLRFKSNLSFGTAGLRGVMMAGTAAMNVYTVRQATQGLCDYIKAHGKTENGIVISYDSRNNSLLFAKESACVAAANGIKVYFFGELRPTPVLSFAVRELHCAAGINITASHNPKEYNGYKAYGEDGSQISPSVADEVSEKIAACRIFEDVATCDFDSAVRSGKIEIIGTDFDEKYIARVLAEQTYPGLLASMPDDFSVIYSPLHGTGYRLVPATLKAAGLKKLYTVDEQMVLDGNFPTVKFPNPEFAEVFSIGISKANEKNADLIIATDPDADRVGIAVKKHDGEFVTITGNQVGALLLEYILTALNERGAMPRLPYAVKSIVSTPLADKICENFGVTMYSVLTGFKFIGEVITDNQDNPDSGFILGFEESYGYLKGTYARDKDAVVATLLITEMAAFYRKQGKTLYDALTMLYEKYGYYLEKTQNLVMPGLDGADKMSKLMDYFHSKTDFSFAGDGVCYVSDYKKGYTLRVSTGDTTPLTMPQSDVLVFVTQSGNQIVVRPSGTEPKIKIYYLLHSDNIASAETVLDSYMNSVSAYVDEATK